MDEFSVLLRIYEKDANLVAKMVTLWRQEFSTKLGKSLDEIRNILSERVLEKILEKLASKEVDESHIKGIMLKIASGSDIAEALKVDKVDENKLEEDIRHIIKEKPGLTAGAYMGMIIAKLGSGIDKRKAMEILNKIIVRK